MNIISWSLLRSRAPETSDGGGWSKPRSNGSRVGASYVIISHKIWSSHVDHSHAHMKPPHAFLFFLDFNIANPPRASTLPSFLLIQTNFVSWYFILTFLKFNNVNLQKHSLHSHFLLFPFFLSLCRFFLVADKEPISPGSYNWATNETIFFW